MGRELQKRKRRSSRAVVKQPSSKSKRLMFPLGNSIVAQNWDKKQTASQNYRRLGLVNRLKAPTGGAEPDRKTKQSGLVSESTATTTTLLKPSKFNSAAATAGSDPFSIALATDAVVSEVRVERDENGKIIRILDDITTTTTNTSSSSSSRKRKAPKANPLNDPLNAFDSDGSDNEDGDEEEEAEEWGGIDEPAELPEGNIIAQLEEEANRPVVKVPRGQSTREREWLGDLVAKHGSNLQAMARDRKLNPMQQTAADIGRRLKKARKDGMEV